MKVIYIEKNQAGSMVLYFFTVILYIFVFFISCHTNEASAGGNQYRFLGCNSASPLGTWCRVLNTNQTRRWDGAAGPLGATLTYGFSITDGVGYVPPNVTHVTPVLALCSGPNSVGDCASGQLTRKTVSGAGWACTPGEPWKNCMNRAVGSPSVLEAQFIGSESGSCLMFRDQSGGMWSTNYYGYACGDSKLPPVVQDTCSLTSSNRWDIAFGNIERSSINVNSGNEQQRNLTLNCTGGRAHDFSVRFVMTATNWSETQMATSNTNLGIQIKLDGTPVSLNKSFSMRFPGQASRTLGFSVLRNSNITANDIATGGFTASGTLVISEL